MSWLPYLVAIGAFLALMAGPFQGERFFDDAYITLRHAHNLAEHGNVGYNTTERVNAASSFGHEFLLAGIHRAFGADLETTALAINIVAGCIVLWCAVYLGAGYVAAAIVPLLAFHAASGMCAVLFAAAVCLLFVALAQRDYLMAAVFAALATLIRLEGALLIFALADWPGVKQAAKVAVGIGAALAVVIGYNLIWFGALFPNPVAAKIAFAYYNVSAFEHARDVGNFFLKRYWFLFFPAVAFAVLRWRERGVLEMAAFIAAGSAFLLVAPFAEYHRYAVHLLPLLAVLAGLAVREWVSTPLAIYAALCLAFGGLIQAPEMHRWATTNTEVAQARFKVAAAVPSGALVLSSDVGAIGYWLHGCEIVDPTGVVSSVPMVRRNAQRVQWIVDTVYPDIHLSGVSLLEHPERHFITRRWTAPVEMHRFEQVAAAELRSRQVSIQAWRLR